jgi:hypothetical protein
MFYPFQGYLSISNIVTYLDCLQAKVNALRELQSPSLHFRGCYAIRERGGVAPAFWADVDAEYS